MDFNDHSRLAGGHAFLSASKYHWIRYDDEKLARMFTAVMAAQRGTQLHDLAKDMIRLKVKPERSGTTFSQYVNDCIGFGMRAEQVLYYSPNCYGTCDAIGFREKQKQLRIFDLKTGVTQTSMDQLQVYTALFCLEYKHRPFDLEIDLRIYQNDEIREYVPNPVDISAIMEQIKYLDNLLKEHMKEAWS